MEKLKISNLMVIDKPDGVQARAMICDGILYIDVEQVIKEDSKTLSYTEDCGYYYEYIIPKNKDVIIKDTENKLVITIKDK